MDDFGKRIPLIWLMGYFLCAGVHFLYMITHIAKHVTGSGAGIRMYLDVAAFVLHYGENLDWESVSQELETLGLRDFANAVFTVVQTCFDIKSPIVLKQTDKTVLADIVELNMKGGIFGRNGRDSGTVSVREESRSGEDVSRIRTIANRLFPSAQTIRSRYTYLQDKPWLLPAAWIHRLIKTREAGKPIQNRRRKSCPRTRKKCGGRLDFTGRSACKLRCRAG